MANIYSQIIAPLSRTELVEIFSEIKEYRRTGILKGDKFRALGRRFPFEIEIRSLEDAVLFEIAQRYAGET